MGFSEKMDDKWVITEITLRTPLKPICTKSGGLNKHLAEGQVDVDDEEGGFSSATTPTSAESRIPNRLNCPPAPKKRKPSSRCNFPRVREFFTPPDLESVFIRRVDWA